MFSKILCPTDGSDHAARALELAIDMAGKYSAKLVILHVPLDNADPQTLKQFAEVEGLTHKVGEEIERLRLLEMRIYTPTEMAIVESAISPRLLLEISEYVIAGARQKAERAGLQAVEAHIENGDPAERILHCIDSEGIDCVVMGSRGLSDLKGLFLGSVSHKVANRAPCTCISVK